MTKLRSAPAALRAWCTRVDALAAALGAPAPSAADEAGVAAALADLVDVRDRSQVWLCLAVLTGRLPEESLVLEVARSAEFDPRALFAAVRSETTDESAACSVVVESERAVVDVAHTVGAPFMTGIQRVVREVAKRWWGRGELRFVGWTEAFDAMRDLTPAECARVREGAPKTGVDPSTGADAVVVPWGTTYVQLELGAELGRSARLRALARFGRSHATALCYDLIPVTSSETSSPGMTGVFAQYLAALKHFDRVCTISEATAVEYRGWRSMLPAAGLTGPEVVPVLLPTSVGESGESEIAAATARLKVGSLPLVLVVGSHEPRKNHLAILQASEVLWREGHEFSLCFIGGRSWRSDEFRDRLRALQNIGRPVESISQADDSLLWAAYRLARFTVFPSLNEGFGLPVAESLAVGTPVITSAFGSTREIAVDGGAVLVDPRDDEDITTAMRTLLVDDAMLERLRAEAVDRPSRTWDDYASEVWDVLIADSRARTSR